MTSRRDANAIVLIVLLSVALFLPAALAEIKSWAGVKGASDQSWSTASNWLPNGVPGPGDDAVIAQLQPTGSLVDVIDITAASSCQSLSLSSSSYLAVTGASLTVIGAVTVNGTVYLDQGQLSAASVLIAGTLNVNRSSTVTSDVVTFRKFLAASPDTGRIYFSPSASVPRCKYESLTINGNVYAIAGRFQMFGGDVATLSYSKLIISGFCNVSNGFKLRFGVLGNWANKNVNLVTANPITGPFAVDPVFSMSTCTGASTSCASGGTTLKRRTMCISSPSDPSPPPPPSSCTTGTDGGMFSFLLGAPGQSVTCTTTTCSPGWTGAGCATPWCLPYNTTVGNCYGHGACAVLGTTTYCQCDSGWTNTDCSVPVCPGSPSGCGAPTRGTCISANTCQCAPGWTGNDCSVPTCNPTCGANADCVPAASGISTDAPSCVCKPGWVNPPACDVQATSCPESPVGDVCGSARSAGQCGTDGITCVCSPDWSGNACEFPLCNGGSGCGQGECIVTAGVHTCNCSAGWSGSACDVPQCFKNSLTGEQCSGNGDCSTASGVPTCVCYAGMTGVDCSLTAQSVQDSAPTPKPGETVIATAPPATDAPTNPSSSDPSSTASTTPILTQPGRSSSKHKSGLSKIGKIGLVVAGVVFVIVLLVIVLSIVFKERVLDLISPKVRSRTAGTSGSGRVRIFTSKTSLVPPDPVA